MVALAIQMTACVVASLTAGIPVVGLVAMWIIMGALTAQAVLILSAMRFLDDLATCQSPPPPITLTPPTPTITTKPF